MKLQIERAVYGGAGLAHETEGEGAGKAVFVPFTLPGEIVEARLLELKNGFAVASLLQVLTASEDRVPPRCDHFGQCGGCQYQHAAYPMHTGEPWAYRNRTRLRVAALEKTLRVGYSGRGSNEFFAIHECPISAPLIWRAAEALLQIAAESSTIARLLRDAVEVEFFITGDEKKLQMTVFMQKVHPGLDALCERMQDLVPELAGAETSLVPSSETKRRVQKPRTLQSWGASGLNYPVAGENYWISRGGFFQINRFLVDELVGIVTAGRRGAVAWDLYAGVGLFSRVLARAFQQVVAVEAAANDLSRSFKGPGKRAVEITTVEFLRSAVVQRERPNLIVMDPPRAGVGAEDCALLARIAPPEIVYVSCDPVTLARDLKMLAAAGYNVVEIHMVDMFPQTFHLETVVILRR